MFFFVCFPSVSHYSFFMVMNLLIFVWLIVKCLLCNFYFDKCCIKKVLLLLSWTKLRCIQLFMVTCVCAQDTANVCVGMCVCVCLYTCGFFWIVTHEAEPASFFLTVSKQVEETHFLQMDLKSVQVLKTGHTCSVHHKTVFELT